MGTVTNARSLQKIAALANLCLFLHFIFAKGSIAETGTVFIPSLKLQDRSDISFAQTGEDKWTLMSQAIFGIVFAGIVQSTQEYKIPRRRGDLMIDEIQDVEPNQAVSIGATIAYRCARNLWAGDNNQLSHNLSPLRDDLMLSALESVSQ